jgi:putative ABC transport system substrate-binding protein
MSEKIFCFALSTVLFALSFSADAQQSKKVSLIGYLTSGDPVIESPRAQAIRLALRDLGHIEGQNIAFEYRYSDRRRRPYDELAVELVNLKVDLILVAGGVGPIRAAMNATKTIPIVMMGAGSDPIAAGLIESLAHPGGNVTGLTNLGRLLGGKQLELLKETAPKTARVAVFYDPGTTGRAREVKEDLAVPARALRLILQPCEIRGTGDFDKVFAALNKQRPDGLYLLGGGPLIRANEKRVVDFTLKSRLPSVYDSTSAVEAGGLMTYGADEANNFRQVAWYIDKILKGAKPGDLPVEQPTKFEFVINLKTAKQIGLTIPPDVLARASRLIK